MLVKYVRNEKGHRVGVVVATNAYNIGWSKCNFKKGDKFDRNMGKKIAVGRANKVGISDEEDVPFLVREVYNHMRNRAISYFKD